LFLKKGGERREFFKKEYLIPVYYYTVFWHAAAPTAPPAPAPAPAPSAPAVVGAAACQNIITHKCVLVIVV
jgi:hypothetical protein